MALYLHELTVGEYSDIYNSSAILEEVTRMVYLFNDKVILISAIIYVVILVILKCFSKQKTAFYFFRSFFYRKKF